jgi:hypothetical protein
MKWLYGCLALCLTIVSVASHADEAKKSTARKKTAPAAVTTDTPSAANLNSELKVVDSTKIDFDAANIDGRMKAPTGFMLQGRKSHSQVNMVELRSNFRNELMDSKSAVMAIPAPIP